MDILNNKKIAELEVEIEKLRKIVSAISSCMDTQLDRLLNHLVNDYIAIQASLGRDIGYGKARIECLGGATIAFFEPETYNIKGVRRRCGGLYQPNPIIGDRTGKFEDIEGDGFYDVVIRDKNGTMLGNIGNVDLTNYGCKRC